MVKGLGSFGAITSFKQRLERLATVRSVTLSLGPTGEFVYRATHPRQIDLGGRDRHPRARLHRGSPGRRLAAGHRPAALSGARRGLCYTRPDGNDREEYPSSGRSREAGHDGCKPAAQREGEVAREPAGSRPIAR